MAKAQEPGLSREPKSLCELCQTQAVPAAGLSWEPGLPLGLFLSQECPAQASRACQEMMEIFECLGLEGTLKPIQYNREDYKALSGD